MRKSAIGKIAIVLAAGIVLGGCASLKGQIGGGGDERAKNLERVIKENNVQQGLLISYEATQDGIAPKLIVIDANTGKLIPPCGEVKCRAPFDFSKEQRGESINSPVDILGEDTYTVRVWKGSVCTTIFSKATGNEYEVCSPPVPKFWRP